MAEQKEKVQFIIDENVLPEQAIISLYQVFTHYDLPMLHISTEADEVGHPIYETELSAKTTVEDFWKEANKITGIRKPISN